MRKVSLLIIVAALLAGNVGCCGKIRSWFHRGSPCGTRAVAPAVLGAPLAIGAPMRAPVSAPMAATMPTMVGGPCQCCPSGPVCVDPCQPCCPSDCCPNPCEGGWTAGYGGYVDGSGCAGCANGSAVSGGYIEQYAAPTEAGGDAAGAYSDDPRPGGDE